MFGFGVTNAHVMRINMTSQTTLSAPYQAVFNKYLYSALLIAEAEDGGYEPISPISTMNEVIEMAQQNFHLRTKELEQGRKPMCPTGYAIWARGHDGAFQRIHEIVQ